MIRKCVAFLFKPYICFQNQVNEKLKKELDESRQEASEKSENLMRELEQLGGDLIQLETEKAALEERLEMEKAALEDKLNAEKGVLEEQLKIEKMAFRDRIKAEREFLDDSIGAMAREIMLAKWKIVDHLEEVEDHSHDLLHCNICGYEGERNTFQTMESDCIFNGGHLVRYVCPECGAVFGPSKFFQQTQQQIDDDYRVHYLGFSEGDSSYKEERAFKMLEPDLKGVYLNYGCGHWSKTLQELRDAGYQVYGYEPYSPDVGNPYMITDKEELKKMRFDGIFSNDLLEHLLDPVSELREMTQILIDEKSKMSHCTSCYTYKYEYTRFHTCFFLGNSVQRMSELAGLQILDQCDDMKENDFYCYVFRPTEKENNLINKMYCNKEAHQEENGVSFHKGGILFGPYLTLLPRQYALYVAVEGEEVDASVSVYNKMGRQVFVQVPLHKGENRISFSVEQKECEIEFVIQNNGVDMRVTEIDLT